MRSTTPKEVLTRRHREDLVLAALERHAHCIRTGQGCEADLSWADLSELDLRGFDFRWCTLRGADFRGAYMSGTLFDGADLRDANFADADCKRATFIAARLANADLSGAKLNSANFDGAGLELAVFNYAQLKHACFARADARFTQFLEANLEASRFDEAHLQSACFEGARLKNANFWRASLRGADIRNADLDRTDFSEAFLTDAVFRVDAPIPKVPALLAQLQRDWQATATFPSFSWYGGESPNCLVERVIELAGRGGTELRTLVGPSTAAALILHASCGAVPNLQSCPGQALQALHRASTTLSKPDASRATRAWGTSLHEERAMFETAPGPTSGAWASSTRWGGSLDYELRITIGGFDTRAEAASFAKHGRLVHAHGRLIFYSEQRPPLLLVAENVEAWRLRDDLLERLQLRGSPRIEDSDFEPVHCSTDRFDEHPGLRQDLYQKKTASEACGATHR